eukprot:6173403-Pleurochrysis_carterae.AAC.2
MKRGLHRFLVSPSPQLGACGERRKLAHGSRNWELVSQQEACASQRPSLPAAASAIDAVQSTCDTALHRSISSCVSNLASQSARRSRSFRRPSRRSVAPALPRRDLGSALAHGNDAFHATLKFTFHRNAKQNAWKSVLRHCRKKADTIDAFN